MIGTDSHTPNAGGLGMVAIGVGGADAVDVMAGWPFNTRVPKLIGVHLTRVAVGLGRGEGHHPEGRRHPHGEGRHRRDRRVLRPGRGVDLGHRARPRSATWAPRSAPRARCSRTTHDTAAYLKATGREAIADLADRVRRVPAQRPRGRRRPGALLRPRDRDRPLRARAAPRRPAHPRPRPPDLRDRGRGRARGLSRRHLGRARRLVHQLVVRRHRPRRARRPPGRGARPAGEDAADDHARLGAGARDDRARRPARRPRGDRRDRARERVRPVHRAVAARRHHAGRARTRSSRRSTATSRRATTATRTRSSFIGSPGDGRRAWRSPAGSTSTSCTSRLTAPDGTTVRSRRPAPTSSARRASTRRVRLQPAGRRPDDGRRSSSRPGPSGSSCSSRSPRGTATTSAACGCCSRRSGKCTTDHISPAGPWLKYRGHLTNISGNLFIGAEQRVRTDEPGIGRRRARRIGRAAARSRRDVQGSRASRWIAIGDENYGEGSSREHAAMEPRFMSGRAVIVRSFARIARGEPEEAGRAAAHVRRPRRLRADPRRRHRRHRRSRRARARAARSRSCCTTPTAPPTSSPPPTRCPTSTSSGSTPAPRSMC